MQLGGESSTFVRRIVRTSKTSFPDEDIVFSDRASDDARDGRVDEGTVFIEKALGCKGSVLSVHFRFGWEVEGEGEKE